MRLRRHIHARVRPSRRIGFGKPVFAPGDDDARSDDQRRAEPGRRQAAGGPRSASHRASPRSAWCSPSRSRWRPRHSAATRSCSNWPTVPRMPSAISSSHCVRRMRRHDERQQQRPSSACRTGANQKTIATDSSVLPRSRIWKLITAISSAAAERRRPRRAAECGSPPGWATMTTPTKPSTTADQRHGPIMFAQTSAAITTANSGVGEAERGRIRPAAAGSPRRS